MTPASSEMAGRSASVARTICVLVCEVVFTNTTPSFRLRKKHEQARPAIGHQLVLLLLRAVRDGQPVAVFVVGRLAVHEQHVMVHLVGGHVGNGHMPSVHLAVASQWHPLPVCE